MPIISAEPIEKSIYRFTLNAGCGQLENIVVSEDGLYIIYFIKDEVSSNRTGRILNVVQNRAYPKNSYILFDWSEDASHRRERIFFYQVQSIVDITPNDAYNIALKHGFVGTVDEWLLSLRGEPGLSAYGLAKEAGFKGTEAEWLASLQGKAGLSVYDIAVSGGFKGTEAEWLLTLKGDAGESAYDIAVKNGFVGTVNEWLLSIQGEIGKTGKSAYETAVEYGFKGTEAEWLASIGDTTEITSKVNVIQSTLTWVRGMNRA